MSSAESAQTSHLAVSSGERGRDFIAETCDWWFVNFPKEAESSDEALRGIEAAIADMNQRCARTGRKVRYGLNPFVAIGASPEAALESAAARIFEVEPNGDKRKIERRMLPATRAGCMGTPAQVQKQLRRFEAMGLELILCKMIPTVANVRLIAAEIVQPMKA